MYVLRMGIDVHLEPFEIDLHLAGVTLALDRLLALGYVVVLGCADVVQYGRDFVGDVGDGFGVAEEKGKHGHVDVHRVTEKDLYLEAAFLFRDDGA